MIFISSVYTMLLIGIFSIYLLVFPFMMTRKQLVAFWMIYILVLAVIGFHVNPPYETDLYRMYLHIDAFRDGSEGVWDSPVIVTNLLYWIVSRTDSNGWFVFVAVVLWGLCVCKILDKYLRVHPYSTRAVALYFFAANGGCFIVYLLASVRCPLATAIWCYSYFNWFRDRKSMYCLLSILAILIHPIALILLGMHMLHYFLMKVRIKGKYVIVFLVILVCGYFLNTTEGNSKLFVLLDLPYAHMLADRLQAYAMRGQEFQQRRELVFRIASSLYLLICLIYLHRKSNFEYELIGFLILIMYAGFDMSIIFERFPYALGICALPIINECYMTTGKLGKVVVGVFGTIILLSQVLWGIYEIILWLNFVG